MLSLPVPKNVIEDIQKLQRAFIWGDTANGMDLHELYMLLIQH